MNEYYLSYHVIDISMAPRIMNQERPLKNLTPRHQIEFFCHTQRESRGPVVLVFNHEQ